MNNYDKLHTNVVICSCRTGDFAVKVVKRCLSDIQGVRHELLPSSCFRCSFPESHQLVARAVSIARPHNARISLITLAAEPEMYNQLAAPMLEDIREVLQEETQQFLRELVEKAQYPVYETVIATGELNAHILDMCRKQNIDLVICGNHNHSFLSRAACAAKSIVASSQVDVLLVPLGGINPPAVNQASLGKVAIFLQIAFMTLRAISRRS